MKPMQIRALKLAADIDVSPSHISELVHGQRPITADTLRLKFGAGRTLQFRHQVARIQSCTSQILKASTVRPSPTRAWFCSTVTVKTARAAREMI